MKRAALYMRVSTVDQHPETQLLDLRQMAAQREYQIVHEYTDRISSAKAKRPGLDAMMTDARHGRFDVVLVWASDRIARSVKHYLDILDELSRIHIEFVSFRENIDTGGPLELDHAGIQRDRGPGQSLREIAKGHRISAATVWRVLHAQTTRLPDQPA